jgi:hypothetical protein
MYDLKLQPEPCQLIELFVKVAKKSSDYERLGKDPMDLVNDFIDDLSPDINEHILDRKKENQFNYGDAICLIIHFYFHPFSNNQGGLH